MSEIFNVNHPLLIPWKGQTFQQITSNVKRNASVDPSLNLQVRNMMLPNRLKIYRREIANPSQIQKYQQQNCYQRTSASIDELDRPGGSMVYSHPVDMNKVNGLAGTLDIKLTEDTYERPGLCTACTPGQNNALSLPQNALRRIRRSGIIKKETDLSEPNTSSYYVNTAQYLKARNANYEQLHTNFLRDGKTLIGSSLSAGNLYTVNGSMKCAKYYITQDTSFGYQWIDSSTNVYTVNIPAGYYDSIDINNALKGTMINNNHYFYTKNSNVQFFLLHITFNNYRNTIELQSMNPNIFADNTVYLIPNKWTNFPSFAHPLWQTVSIIENNPRDPYPTQWTLTDTAIMPSFVINNNLFATVAGFQQGSYPANPILASKMSEIPIIHSSDTTSLVKSRYMPVFFKPNNPQFAQQGAVSSASLTNRKKYDTIINTNTLYVNSRGPFISNSVAYNTGTTGYNLKELIGYPIKCTPVFSKTTGEMKKKC
jgi:hypothetical protein